MFASDKADKVTPATTTTQDEESPSLEVPQVPQLPFSDTAAPSPLTTTRPNSSVLAPLVEGEVSETRASLDSKSHTEAFGILPYQRHMKAENVFDAIEEQIQIDVLQQQYPGFSPSSQAQYAETSPSNHDAVQATQTATAVSNNEVGAMTPAISPAKKAKDGQPQMRCLVVDDDNMTRKLMSRMLSKMGHKIDQAENGKLAYEMLRSLHVEDIANQYDIVFLDNQMPVMTGVECTRELRSIGCPIFICGATGNALQDDQQEYLDAGADRSELSCALLCSATETNAHDSCFALVFHHSSPD